MRRIATVAVSAAALLALSASAANAEDDAARADPGKSLTNAIDKLFDPGTPGGKVDQAVGSTASGLGDGIKGLLSSS
ncbi:hypothetical protein GCM10010211_75130 [Streptomyces albospinus]|uniref:Secreted protein n=1 Tax=Streptomyces albospinus TaxID=285515 RepID=A0ABQ2VLN6_9ACTN|nr:hypothetical protein [Streptomyces albospinus]GGU96766.1 hypothetical protein GCM10010211_75130 [Streptomyces albospinus]